MGETNKNPTFLPVLPTAFYPYSFIGGGHAKTLLREVEKPGFDGSWDLYVGLAEYSRLWTHARCPWKATVSYQAWQTSISCFDNL